MLKRIFQRRSVSNPLQSLLERERFVNGHFSYNNWNIEYSDAASLYSNIDLLVNKKVNSFIANIENPYIIDCGSNIGISILEYKREYPSAKIIGFEPDPVIFEILKRNLENNGADDVQIFNAAVWVENSTLNFKCDGSDGGHLCKEADKDTTIMVDALDIAKFLKEPVDLIKIDIEGAEKQVVPYVLNYSDNIERIIIEYHYSSKIPESLYSLSKILRLLKEKNYIVFINSFGPWRDLFSRQEHSDLGYDQYYLITAEKD